jgi:hypothetical protein
LPLSSTPSRSWLANLDEDFVGRNGCLPRKLKDGFPGHESQTVPEAGFGGKKNGELLLLAEEAKFEIFLTVDQGLAYQQNLMGRSIAILTLQAPTNRLEDLLP